jgi:aryl-alcohol dehydrogenase-like predicted oxidoreductase
VPLNETLAGFQTLKRAGKKREYGVSNSDVDDMKEAFDLPGGNEIVPATIPDHPASATLRFTVTRLSATPERRRVLVASALTFVPASITTALARPNSP